MFSGLEMAGSYSFWSKSFIMLRVSLLSSMKSTWLLRCSMSRLASGLGLYMPKNFSVLTAKISLS